MRCSIVIRAFNEERHLGRLLEGIGQQTLKDVEIILVDSGSTDGTLEIAGRFQVQVVHIQPGEFTFGRSLNLGISHAGGPVIVIASAHVYPVYPDWLERLLAALADAQVALAYGRQRGNAASKFSEQQIFARWYPGQSDLHQVHPFCNNANAAIRRDLWEQHPYDETLSGLEDLAWANWAVSRGHRLAYVAEAEVVHVHNETPAGAYNRYRREAMAYRRIFPNEQFHFRHFLKLVTTNIASDLLQSARQGVLSVHFRSIFWFRWVQFWGTYQGYRHAGPLNWQLRQTFYYPGGLESPQGLAARDVKPIEYSE